MLICLRALLPVQAETRALRAARPPSLSFSLLQSSSLVVYHLPSLPVRGADISRAAVVVVIIKMARARVLYLASLFISAFSNVRFLSPRLSTISVWYIVGRRGFGSGIVADLGWRYEDYENGWWDGFLLD